MSTHPEPQGPRTVEQVRQPQRFGQEPEGDGLPFQGPMEPHDVERRIVAIDEALGNLTGTHVEIAEQAGRAEARWKNHRDRVIVALVKSGEKGARDIREALAKQRSCGAMNCPCAQDPWAGETLYREHEVLENRKDASAKAMRAIEARLNAFQTIAANIRAAAR